MWLLSVCCSSSQQHVSESSWMKMIVAKNNTATLKKLHKGKKKKKKVNLHLILKVRHTSVLNASLRQPLRKAFHTHFLWPAWTLLTQTSEGLTTQSLFQVTGLDNWW